MNLFNSWRSRLTVVLVAAAVPLTLGGAVAQAAPSAQVRLATLARTAPARKVVAIVEFKPGFSEAKARATVRKHSGRVTGRLPLINGLSVKLSAREAQRLSHERSVVGVTLNSRVSSQSLDASRLLSAYPKTISAPNLWQRGITGRGIGVAVIDTGIAGNVADFKGAGGTSRVVANVVTSQGARTAGDAFGHGTHVAGIIAGNAFNRSPYDPFYGRYVGIAPEANLIAVKASDDNGNSTVLDVINGLQFVVDHKDEFNIRVVNLSLSSDTPQSYKTDPLDAAVEYAWQKGIVVVAAVGNRGAVADAVQYAPGNDPYVISVGGSDETITSGKSERASWSSTGRTQDGILKPDVMAPGAHIVSTFAPGSVFQSLCPACVIGGSYFKAGGTSMAAPVVAGAVALLLQQRPYLTPDQIKQLLMSTDSPIKGSLGAGEINVDKASAMLVPAGPAGLANRGLTPSTLLAYLLNYGGTSTWTRSSWSIASGALAAGWARSSWSCKGCDDSGAAVDSTRSSWSRSSWSSFGEDESAADEAPAADDTNPDAPASPADPAPAADPATPPGPAPDADPTNPAPTDGPS
jgi:serine protease AprX